MELSIYSDSFQADADWATCSLPIATWRQVTEENPASRLIGRISVEGRDIYVALGQPCEEGDGIFVPSYMLDHLGVEGCGEKVLVEWLSQDAFPEATRIVLRPEDSAFYYADAKEELERALTRLGILREGDTFVVPLVMLDGYKTAFNIVRTEPANIVLAEGDEVVIEFEEALDVAEPEDEFGDFVEATESMVAEPEQEPQPEVKGQTLGGAIRYNADGSRWNPWKDV
jgi:hypothetical protein